MGDLMDAVLRIHPETGVQRVGDRLLAASPDDFLHTFEDASGTVSEVAERIVELADGQRTLREIVSVLCGEFEVSPEVCAQDAREFVKVLLDRKVLALGEPPRAVKAR